MTIARIDRNFTITHLARRGSCGGTWVKGMIRGHRFEALVFRDHAMDPSWEIAFSRISKLCLRRLADGEIVYSWDRGQDIPPQSQDTQSAIELLVATLAERIYGPDTD